MGKKAEQHTGACPVSEPGKFKLAHSAPCWLMTTNVTFTEDHQRRPHFHRRSRPHYHPCHRSPHHHRLGRHLAHSVMPSTPLRVPRVRKCRVGSERDSASAEAGPRGYRLRNMVERRQEGTRHGKGRYARRTGSWGSRTSATSGGKSVTV